MLNLNLNLRPQTAKRLKIVIEQTRDEETFAQNVIAYEVAEIKRAQLNLRLDMQAFEKKYNLSSEEFHEKYRQGTMGDDADILLWAGLVEMLEKNEKRLQGLEG